MCFWLNQQLLRVILLLNWWRSNAGSPRIFKTNTATNWNDWINCLTIKQVSLGGFFRLKPHQNWLGKIGCFWLEGKLTMYNVKISDFGLFLGHTNFCDWINPHLFGGLLECLGYLLVYVDWFIDTQTTISILGLLVSDKFFNRNKIWPFNAGWLRTSCFFKGTLGTLDSSPNSYIFWTPNPQATRISDLGPITVGSEGSPWISAHKTQDY